MDTYSFLRELADSYVLAILFGVFVFVVLWAFRPGSRPVHADAANVVFRHDTLPDTARSKTGCANDCADCACTIPDFTKERANG